MALDPKEYKKTQYVFKDVSDKIKYEKVPMLINVSCVDSIRAAEELISAVMSKFAIEKKIDYKYKNYFHPYETTVSLVINGLVKVVDYNDIRDIQDSDVEKIKMAELIHKEVTISEADNVISDARARYLTNTIDNKRSGRLVAVNIDTISMNFKANDEVTLEDLKGLGLVPENTGRIKVLARGVIDKPLTIIADGFSLQAIKMIILTGGEPIQCQ